MRIEDVKISVGDKVKHIGYIDYDNCSFTTVRMRSKHFHRKLNAWALDYGLFLNLIKNKINKISLLDKEGKRMYITTVQNILDKGIIKDYGYGVQIFLPIEYWNSDII